MDQYLRFQDSRISLEQTAIKKFHLRRQNGYHIQQRVADDSLRGFPFPAKLDTIGGVLSNFLSVLLDNNWPRGLKLCNDFISHALNSFGLNVLRWLRGIQYTVVCSDFVQHVFKFFLMRSLYLRAILCTAIDGMIHTTREAVCIAF